MTRASAILRRYGIRPRKRLGQSFLEDRSVMEKIVAAAEIDRDDFVVEIGAGVGIMTELIAARAEKVIALEIDPLLADILRERVGGEGNVEIVEGDALAFDLPLAARRSAKGRLKIIGNVPYYISSPILFAVIAARQAIESAVMMLQEEVADRIVAAPGSKVYGIPSVIASMYAALSREMTVPADCFYPPPKETSSVIRLVIRERPLIDLCDHDFFRKIVKIAFSRRRKTILNNLKSGLAPGGFSEKDIHDALREAEIDGQRRGETLSALEYGVMSNILFSVMERQKSLDKKIRP